MGTVISQLCLLRSDRGDDLGHAEVGLQKRYIPIRGIASHLMDDVQSRL